MTFENSQLNGIEDHFLICFKSFPVKKHFSQDFEPLLPTLLQHSYFKVVFSLLCYSIVILRLYSDACWRSLGESHIRIKNRSSHLSQSTFPITKHLFIVIIFPFSCILLGEYAKYRRVSKHTLSLKYDSPSSCHPLANPHRSSFPCSNAISSPVDISECVFYPRQLHIDSSFVKSYSQPETQFPRQIIHIYIHIYVCINIYIHIHIYIYTHTVYIQTVSLMSFITKISQTDFL